MTLTACLFAALPLLGLPHAVGTLNLSDTTSTYVRGASTADGPAFDVDTLAVGQARLRFRATELRVDYAPRVTLRDMESGERSVSALHEAAAGIGHQTTRLRLGLSQTLTLGRQYFSNLGPAGVPSTPDATSTGVDTPMVPLASTPDVQLLPNVRSQRVRSQQTVASFTYLWTPRWSSELRGSYLVAGGRGEAEQLLQPLRREANAAAGLSVVVTPRQQLTSVGTLSHMRVSNGFEHWLTGLGESWSAQWTRTLSSSFTLGGVWRRTLRPDGSERSSVVPDSGAELSYDAARGAVDVTLKASGALAPLINTLTGEFQVAGRGRLTGALRYHRSTALLMLDAYQTVPADRLLATRLVGGGIEVGQLLTTELSIGGAARLLHQQIEGTLLSLPLQWALSVSVRVQIRTLRF